MDENIGTITTLNMMGDTKYTWSRTSAKECEAAHEHFTAMKAKGFLIFKVKWLGLRKGEAVEQFDPKAEALTYVEPPHAAEIATSFDPKANYVVTPMACGG